jgi:hypothetical protein
MVMVALSAVTVDGVKGTLKLQPLPGVNEAGSVPQVFVAAKSLEFGPLVAMPEMFNVALPVFVSVTICDPLVVNTVWFPKEMLVPDSVATGVLGTTSSKAPMSQAGPCGRDTPRWSVAMGFPLVSVQ